MHSGYDATIKKNLRLIFNTIKQYNTELIRGTIELNSLQSRDVSQNVPGQISGFAHLWFRSIINLNTPQCALARHENVVNVFDEITQRTHIHY